MRFVGLIAAGLLVVSCSIPPGPSGPGVALVHLEVREGGSLESQVVARINRFRAQKGLAPLTRHGGLDRIAEGHARDMMRKRKMSHDGFRGRAHVAEVSHGLSRLNENVMWGLGYEQADLAGIIVQGWIDSPGHRKNLLSDNEFIGVGISRDRGGTVWAAQVSARPLARSREADWEHADVLF